jgi:hypothetical protein
MSPRRHRRSRAGVAELRDFVYDEDDVLVDTFLESVDWPALKRLPGMGRMGGGSEVCRASNFAPGAVI